LGCVRVSARTGCRARRRQIGLDLDGPASRDDQIALALLLDGSGVLRFEPQIQVPEPRHLVGDGYGGTPQLRLLMPARKSSHQGRL